MDQRGWVLACASGVACVIGSSIICIDIILRPIPRWRHFNIRESTTFLAASLSLSFGVMFFSALYGMLPKSKEYLLTSGFSPRTASAILTASFLAGVGGLQIVSEFLHYCLPSSIVNCDEHGREHERYHAVLNRQDNSFRREHDRTPLLDGQASIANKISVSVTNLVRGCTGGGRGGKCYGFSDHDCEQKCAGERGKLLEGAEVVAPGSSGSGSGSSGDEVEEVEVDAERGYGSVGNHHHQHHHHHHHHHHSTHSTLDRERETRGETPGHHHVADNKFLSIGVQTSIAIALHKIPEGFITYATNHANPTLGLAVFLAIFIHNISEGFAMSLPLFLALRSRSRAILWASLLGGISQPLGAAIAALGTRSGRRELEGHEAGYGVLFAITAGIMCSVGLQLFSQAVQIHHGQRVPFVFGFIGMGLLGISFGLTA